MSPFCVTIELTPFTSLVSPGETLKSSLFSTKSSDNLTGRICIGDRDMAYLLVTTQCIQGEAETEDVLIVTFVPQGLQAEPFEICHNEL
jgi:hypothetical protein